MLGAMVVAFALAAGVGDPTETATPTPTATSTTTTTPTTTTTTTPTTTTMPTTTSTTTTSESSSEQAPASDAAALGAAPRGPLLADSASVLLSRVERPSGHAVERLIEPSGDLVEHEVNAAGTVQSCRKVGSLLALRIVEQKPAAGGEYLEVARDASGALVQFVVDAEGEPRAVSLLAPPP